MARNPWRDLAGLVVNGIADVGATEVKRQAGEFLGLPRTPPGRSGPAPDFDDLVADAAVDAGCQPEWQEDGSAVIRVAHGGRSFRAEIRRYGPFVQVAVHTDLGTPLSDFGRTAVLLMRRAAGVHFGGWAWWPKDGGVAVFCKVMMPADQLTGEKVHGLAKFVAKEVAEAGEQFGS